VYLNDSQLVIARLPCGKMHYGKLLTHSPPLQSKLYYVL